MSGVIEEFDDIKMSDFRTKFTENDVRVYIPVKYLHEGEERYPFTFKTLGEATAFIRGFCHGNDRCYE